MSLSKLSIGASSVVSGEKGNNSHMVDLRWVKEYLSTMMKRSMLEEPEANLHCRGIGVVTRRWRQMGKRPLSRVTKLKPGDDGTVCVVELRTKNATCTRSASWMTIECHIVTSSRGGVMLPA